MRTDHTVTVAAEPGDRLTLGVLREVLTTQDVPDDAFIEPVLRQLGSQHDPITVLAGIVVKWSTP